MGKSYLIGAISQTLQNAASPQRSPLLLLAPTRVVAFNIGASTIHYKLRIPIKEFSELQGTRLTTFQEEISHIKYILIDEMSFLGEMLLENIDSRLRQAFLENSHKIFEGISMILVGDLAQLPPVKDRVAYESKRCARILWEEFKTIVTLRRIFRQDGQSNEQERFRLLLTNIRDANPTIDDWMLLMSRSNGNMSIATNDEFENSVHLFSTNDNVHTHSKRKLYSLKNPIARSIAVKTKTLSSIEGDGNDEFDMELLLRKYARVMLTSNLWIEAGLVNGALGYIRSIVYRPGSAPPLPPSYVLVDFDGYSGIPFDDRHPQRVPIPTIDKASTK
ncbi:ATP-dependent DNA helicase RRM3-like [Cryptomeria japonica]|uniref:ATP-dependent DNA helicase RRM3-like n=1 Tax=Cryptomeria japonica TaxID=3369 RepID=UPI0027DA5E24|nr:ATP-dependent DNA helicase RRM3-like [Cryptomeria japonica]